MTDKDGNEVVVGARCRFFVDTREEWMNGTVRVLATKGPFVGHARVDDGAHDNDDLATNGFHVSAWVEPQDLQVLGERA
jgi:hypothetical protein